MFAHPHLSTGYHGNKIPCLSIMKSYTGFLIVKGSVGSLVNLLTPRTTAAHWPSSRDKRMFHIFCFNIHGTQEVESNFAYYRMMIAWHFTSPFSSSVIPKQDFAGQLSPASFKSLQTPLKAFSPKAGTQSNGTIWVCSDRENQPFISILKGFVNGGIQKTEPVKRISAGTLNRGAPFSAVYEHPSSKTCTNHIQFSQWLLWCKDDGREGAPLPFYMFQLIDFHAVSPPLYNQIHLLSFHSLIHVTQDHVFWQHY